MATDIPRTAARPSGYTAVTPWIISADTAKLLDFVKRAFGAEEIARLPNPSRPGIGHAEFRIGDAVLMAFDAWPGWPETQCFLRLFVDDADAVYERALRAGASPVTRVTLLLFGDRVGRVRDPLGNIWWIQTHVEDVPMAEMQRRATDQQHVDAMAYVQASLDTAMKAPKPRPE